MARKLVVCLAIALGASLLAAASGHAGLARLVGPSREAIIYDGDLSVDSGGIEVVPWGSGKAEQVYEATYVGPQVLKVASQGSHQGIVLKLNRPADLASFAEAGQGYLDLRLLPAQPSLAFRRQQAELQRQQARTGAGMAGGRGGGRGGAGGGMGGGRGGAGGGMGGGRAGGGMGGARGGAGGGMGGGRAGGGMGGARGGAGGGMGGGRAGGGMGGARGGAGGGMGGGRAGGGMGGGRAGGMRGGMGGQTGRGQTAAPVGAAAAPPDTGERTLAVRNLRVVLFTDKGAMVADGVPVHREAKDERGWVTVSVPLAQLKGPTDASQVRAIGVFGDESDVFYLGRVRLLEDRRPVEVTVKADPMFARTGQVVEFTAQVRGGPVDARISWSFDRRLGDREQAIGSRVRYVYKQPGDYIVTCTVTDRAGVREQASASVGIKVE